MTRSAYGHAYQRKGSDRWYIRVPTGAKTASGRTAYRVRAVGTEKQARAVLARLHEQRVLGRYVPAASYSESLAVAVQAYIDAKDRPKSTLRSYRRALRKMIEHGIGARSPASLTPAVIEEWVRWCGGAARTRNGYLAVVSGALARLVRNGHLASNPAKLVKSAKEPDNHHRVLTASEVKRLIRVADGQLLAFIVFALRTGQRREEMLSLLWRDVDLAGRSARIVQKKTGTSRVVRLHPEVVRELNHLRASCRHIPAHDDRVFPSSTGGPWRPGPVWHAVCREAQIDGVVIHSMRHTFATYYLASGGSIRNLQHILGHASVTTTEKYARMLPDVAGREVDALEFGVKKRTRSVPPADASS